MSDLFSSGSSSQALSGGEDISFVCPRCAAEVTGRFYGPCADCRQQLRAAYAGLARDVEAAEYVPKMNVTPNAVALKDD